MADLSNAICEFVQERAAVDYPVSSFYTSVAKRWSDIHKCYWALKEPALFNARSRANGVALHLLSEYSATAAFIIKIALIAKCTQDLLEQHKKLHTALSDFKKIRNDEFPRYHQYQWKNLNKTSYLQTVASLHVFVYFKGVKFLDQTSRVIRCSFIVFSQVLSYGVLLTDIYLIANGDALAHLRACTAMIGCWREYQTKLAENYLLVLQELEKREEVVNLVCQKIGMNKRTNDIIKDLRHFAIQAGKAIPEIINTIDDVANPIITPGKITAINFEIPTEQPANAPEEQRYPPKLNKVATQKNAEDPDPDPILSKTS